jgi:hypothetical protein
MFQSVLATVAHRAVNGGGMHQFNLQWFSGSYFGGLEKNVFGTALLDGSVEPGWYLHTVGSRQKIYGGIPIDYFNAVNQSELYVKRCTRKYGRTYKTSPHKTSPRQNVSSTKRLLDKTSPYKTSP